MSNLKVLGLELQPLSLFFTHQYLIRETVFVPLQFYFWYAVWFPKIPSTVKPVKNFV